MIEISQLTSEHCSGVQGQKPNCWLPSCFFFIYLFSKSSDTHSDLKMIREVNDDKIERYISRAMFIIIFVAAIFLNDSLVVANTSISIAVCKPELCVCSFFLDFLSFFFWKPVQGQFCVTHP